MQISKYFLNVSRGNPGQRIDNRGVLFDLLIPAQSILEHFLVITN